MFARPSPSATAAPRPASGLIRPRRRGCGRMRARSSTGSPPESSVPSRSSCGSDGGASSARRRPCARPARRLYARAPAQRVSGAACLPTCRPAAGTRRTAAEPARARQPGLPRTGEGIEFADLRPLVAGDRVRSINWRASPARRSVRQPAASGAERGHRPVPRHSRVRARGSGDHACSARLHVSDAARPRRLVSFGGVLSWLVGSPGTRQLYRIVDALLESHVKPSFRWTDITHVPGHLLPARALVADGQRSNRRVARPPRARLRPRRGRDLALGSGRCRLPPTAAAALAAPARNAARTLREARRAGRAVGAPVHGPRTRDRGGDLVPPARSTSRASSDRRRVAHGGSHPRRRGRPRSRKPSAGHGWRGRSDRSWVSVPRRSEAIPIALLLLARCT